MKVYYYNSYLKVNCAKTFTTVEEMKNFFNKYKMLKVIRIEQV